MAPPIKANRDAPTHAAPMEVGLFWSFVEQAKALSFALGLPRHVALADLLSHESAESSASFRATFAELASRAQGLPGMRAAFGGPDDAFAHAISGLISEGRGAYGSAMADPASLRGPFGERSAHGPASSETSAHAKPRPSPRARWELNPAMTS